MINLPGSALHHPHQLELKCGSFFCLNFWSHCLSIRLSVNFSTFIFLSWTTGPISTKLGTKHSCIKIIQVCSNFFQRGDLKMFSSRTTGPISTKLCTRHIRWKGLKFVQIKGHTFLQGEIMVKINALTIFKTTKLDTKHSLVKIIQVCTNEGPCIFPMENNNKLAKIHWWHVLKVYKGR